jgi:hypothetical protein
MYFLYSERRETTTGAYQRSFVAECGGAGSAEVCGCGAAALGTPTVAGSIGWFAGRVSEFAAIQSDVVPCLVANTISGESPAQEPEQLLRRGAASGGGVIPCLGPCLAIGCLRPKHVEAPKPHTVLSQQHCWRMSNICYSNNQGNIMKGFISDNPPPRLHANSSHPDRPDT